MKEDKLNHLFFDPDNKDGGYCTEFAGNPSELARALFHTARVNPMWREIISSVHLSILEMEEIDKGEHIVKHKD